MEIAWEQPLVEFADNVTSQTREATTACGENLTAVVDPAPDIALSVIKGLAMTFIIIATLVGNLLVIVSVCRFRYLRVMNNYFIVSLAVADFLVGGVVMPFNAYNQVVSWDWQFGRVVCDIFNANDVWFTTTSLLHLGCISIDRYMAIMSPFSYEKRMNRKRVLLMLSISWVLSALLAYVPVFTGLYTTAEHLEKMKRDPNLCDFNVSRPYAFVSSGISFWLPCLTMIITYQKILREAMAQEKHIRALQIYKSDESRTKSDESRTFVGNHGDGGVNEDDDYDYAGARRNKRGASSSLSQALRAFIRRDSKQARKLRREHRAAKTLGLIMGIFILCYFPFFVWYTLTFGVCPVTCTLDAKYIPFMFWLGYMNSCANPVIYAFYNKDFKVAFRKLLGWKTLSHGKKFSVSDECADVTQTIEQRNGSDCETAPCNVSKGSIS